VLFQSVGLSQVLIVYKRWSVNDDYYSQINTSNFEKWLKENLIQIIPGNKRHTSLGACAWFPKNRMLTETALSEGIF
jgi:hypothetical protein